METSASPSKQWELASHLTAFTGFLIPFGNIIGPFVVWSMKKEEFPSVDAHGKESLNFQISFSLYFCCSLVLLFLLIGFIIIPALIIMQLIFVIIASVKADKGELYRYPLSIRFIK
ncbi:MAG: DUF4870 domain-containing protein [Bacteroidota bacterium]|nr:DUF4870 domain-containing protein [Bacteroidota bacterium]